MTFFTQLLSLIFGFGLGILIVVYHRTIVRMVGLNSWAERAFSSGGTYTMWQLIGIGVIIATLLYVTNSFNVFFNAIGHIFGF